MSKRTVVFLIFAAAAALALFVAAFYLKSDANTIDNVHWNGTPLPPCFADARTCGGHLLGTDEVGRDLLARLIVGASVTLGVSLLAVLLEFGIAATLVFLTRNVRLTRYVVTRLADAISCVPVWPFMVLLLLIMGNSRWYHGLSVISLTAAILTWPGLYYLAIDNRATHELLNQAARDWAKIILVLATVDFFGLGTQPPTPSWGNMLNNAQSNIQIGWWAVVFPALCIFIAVLGIEVAARTVFRNAVRLSTERVHSLMGEPKA